VVNGNRNVGASMAHIIRGHRVGKVGELRLGCSVAVFDPSRQKILLMRRDDNGLWCLPSGGMEPGESASETAVREVAEETGLTVRVSGLIGVYTSPDVLVQYADGNRFQIVSLCFEAIVESGMLQVSHEATDLRFVAPSELASMPVMENQVERIEDAFGFEWEAFIR